MGLLDIAALQGSAPGVSPGMGWLGLMMPGVKSVADAEYNAAGADEAQKARDEAAAVLAKRMRQQNPGGVPPFGKEFESGLPAPVSQIGAGNLGSLSPVVPEDKPALGADDKPSPLDTAPWPAGPVGAPLPNREVAPRPIAAAPGSVDDTTLPPNATPTMGTTPPGVTDVSAAGKPQPSLLERIGNGLSDNSNLLLALGSGFAGASSLGEGMQRAFTAAGPAAAQNQTVRALVGKGLTPDMARLVATNPTLMQQIAPQLFGVKQRTFTQIGEDMFGNKRFGFVDPVSNKVYDVSGAEITGQGAPGGAPGGTGGTGGVGAFTVNGAPIDSSLSGDDYLKQFVPEVQAAVKDYLGGRSMPTGNPRAGFTQGIKMLAQKYGSDIGMQADDTSFAARRTMRTQLSSAAPNSLGGQINTGNTAIGHLADLSQKAVELGNVDFLGPDASHVINSVRGHLSTDQSAKLDALKGAAQHYGQEITKFYAGSPGGEAERDRFLGLVNGAKTPKELASILETEAELMRSRLGSIDSQIRGTLGPDGVAQYPVVRPESEKAFTTLSRNISSLRGTAPASTAAPSSAQPGKPVAPGAYVWTPNNGLVPVQ